MEHAIEECLTVGQLKQILKDLPDDLDVITMDEDFNRCCEIVKIVVKSNLVGMMISDYE